MKTPSPRQQRLQSLDDSVVRLGPQTIHIDITNSCNTDCVTCWDHSPFLEEARPAAWKRNRADPGAIGEMLDDIETLGGLQAVIVSGMGEPFTHPGVYEILGDLKARGLHVTVITNLLAADESRIIELGVDTLLIGIHGATRGSYLEFHPSWSPMHWDRLHASLGRLRAAGRHDKHVQVICKTNARELARMVELADRYAAQRVNFKLASLRAGTEAVGITAEQRAWLLDTGIETARKRAQDLGVVHNLTVFEDQVRAGGEATAPIEDVGCFLGYHYSRITVDGTVLYCCNTEVVVGTLASGDAFSTLWHGARWNALRDRLRRGDYFPGCHQCGKLNQNVKLSDRFRERYGSQRWLEVTGRALPPSLPASPPTTADIGRALHKRSLKVLS